MASTSCVAWSGTFPSWSRLSSTMPAGKAIRLRSGVGRTLTRVDRRLKALLQVPDRHVPLAGERLCRSRERVLECVGQSRMVALGNRLGDWCSFHGRSDEKSGYGL